MNFTELALYKCYLLIIIIIIIIILLLLLLLLLLLFVLLLLLVCLGTCLSEKFQQIDNNFPWSVLLPTIEMTSTCSKLEWHHKPQASGFTAKHSSPPISAREIAQLL